LWSGKPVEDPRSDGIEEIGDACIGEVCFGLRRSGDEDEGSSVSSQTNPLPPEVCLTDPSLSLNPQGCESGMVAADERFERREFGGATDNCLP
jgi:hypothetical protein